MNPPQSSRHMLTVSSGQSALSCDFWLPKLQFRVRLSMVSSPDGDFRDSRGGF